MFSVDYKGKRTAFTYTRTGNVVTKPDGVVVGTVKKRTDHRGRNIWVAKAVDGLVAVGDTRDQATKDMLGFIKTHDGHETPEGMRSSMGANVIIKAVYGGEYDGRGSWDMVTFRGKDHAERCQCCYEEIRDRKTVRPPQPSGAVTYFQCR